MLSLDDALDGARAATTDLGAPDAAGRMAVALTHVGLARVHYLESALGGTCTARCVVGPDSSPSMNPVRLASGFTTGGFLEWESEDDFVLVDMLPNCCGMTVARVPLREDLDSYYARLRRLAETPPIVDGQRIIVDLNRKNHFLGLFRDDEDCVYGVVHCSAPEFKTDNALGMGLSRVESKRLASVVEVLKTPLGELRYLSGKAAAEFRRVSEVAASFAEAKRRRILEEVFGVADVVRGALHQGYDGDARVLLGAQRVEDEGPYLFLLGPYDASYLVEPCTRKSDTFVPHGGGYRWVAEIASASVSYDNGFLFDLQTQAGTRFLTRSLDTLPFTYRREESLQHAEDLGLVRRLSPLHPVATLRV